MPGLADIALGNGLGASLAQDGLYGPQDPEAQEPVGYRMLDHFPTGTRVAGWNAWRASNTIMKAKGGGTPLGTGMKSSLRSTFSPFQFGKLRSYESITGMGDSVYSPFNLFAKEGNRVMNAAAKRAPEGFASKTLNEGSGSTFFDAGTYSRLSTASRLDNVNDMAKSGSRNFKKAERAKKGARGFIEATDSTLHKAMQNNIHPITGKAYGDAVAMSGNGVLSGKFSGFMRASKGGVGAESQALASAAGKLDFLKGAQTAERWASLGGAAPGERVGFSHVMNAWRGDKMGEHAARYSGKHIPGVAADKAAGTAAARGAAEFGGGLVERGGAGAALKTGTVAVGGKVALAIPVVNALATALLVKDVVQFGMEGVKEIPGMVKDTFTSFKGGIQKPVFGNRYVDNEVAATSRQRGVMAIQNSQLNARSVLGNEASRLHAYYDGRPA